MIDATSATSSTTSAAFVSQQAAEKDMDRDDFLKLLVAQLKNQDPLKPQDNSQFVAELAQFSSLEQTMGINERLDLLAVQSRGQSNTEAIGLVGQSATVRGSIATIDGSGIGSPITFTLDGDAESTVVTIRDQNGRTVRTLDLGSHDAGLVRISWDGRDAAGVVQPAGSYVVGVAAKAPGDNPVQVSQQTTSTVAGISFDQGYPVLHLANGVSVPVSDLLRVDSPPTNP